jgi:hypothetical protein
VNLRMLFQRKRKESRQRVPGHTWTSWPEACPRLLRRPSMLHAVPELLDAIEARLIAGEDTAALLAGIRWSELVGWPEDGMTAHALKQRVIAIQTLIMGLQSPLRAAFSEMSGSPVYGRDGFTAEAPARTQRLQGKV